MCSICSTKKQSEPLLTLNTVWITWSDNPSLLLLLLSQFWTMPHHLQKKWRGDLMQTASFYVRWVYLRRGEKCCTLGWTNLCIDFWNQSLSRSTTNACLYLVLGFKELSIFLYPDNSHLCSGLGCFRVIHYFCLCYSCFSLWCQLQFFISLTKPCVQTEPLQPHCLGGSRQCPAGTWHCCSSKSAHVSLGNGVLIESLN